MRNPATEEQLWSYLVQLTSALRCIHSAGLAARPGCLMPSKASPRGRMLWCCEALRTLCHGQTACVQHCAVVCLQTACLPAA